MDCEARRGFKKKRTKTRYMDEEQLILELFQQEHRLAPAAEDLRRSLNKIIDRYHLDGKDVLSLLARVSAGYIRILEKAFDIESGKTLVVDTFQNILSIYLTHVDMSNVPVEVEKMEREKLN